MRRADPLQADRRDQLADVSKPRPHVGRQRVELPIHGGVQGLNAPSHGRNSIAILLYIQLLVEQGKTAGLFQTTETASR